MGAEGRAGYDNFVHSEDRYCPGRQVSQIEVGTKLHRHRLSLPKMIIF